MNINLTKWWTIFLLSLILGTAIFLRIYRLDSVPPALSWDEVAVGYNGYSIANWGKDEWGETFPIVFKSFEDDKHPIHVYFTALSIKLLGLSDFSTRLPSAVFGSLSVLVIFFLSRNLFQASLVGLISALFLAISPYNLQFSRFNHEANFALFFFLLGLWMFFLGVKMKNWCLALSFLSFGLSLTAYQSSEVVLPPIIILLVILYFGDLVKMKKMFFVSVGVFLLLSSLFVIEPSLLGGARIEQNKPSFDLVKNEFLYQKTHNQLIGRAQLVSESYIKYFSLNYLFVSGDSNPRHSIQKIGEFYKLDVVFLFLGILSLLAYRSKVTLVVLAWALLAPLPGALSSLDPHAARSLFTMGSWHIIAGLGFYRIILFFKKINLHFLIVALGLLVLSWEFKNYLDNYYNFYPQKYAIEWQYGMRDIVEFVKGHSGYGPIYTTDVRHQPYIFFLYYLKFPQPDFRSSVSYNYSQSRAYNLVSSFGNYHFGDWNFIDSPADQLTLYAVSPYEYSGMKNRLLFDVKKIIRYPDKTDAFYLVSYP